MAESWLSQEIDLPMEDVERLIAGMRLVQDGAFGLTRFDNEVDGGERRLSVIRTDKGMRLSLARPGPEPGPVGV